MGRSNRRIGRYRIGNLSERNKKKEGVLIIWNKVTENDWKQKEAKKNWFLKPHLCSQLQLNGAHAC